MKTTFGTHQEVCHVWASRSQERGKADYFRFKGDILYCWGRPVARFYGKKTVLLAPEWIVDCRMRHKINVAIPKGYKVLELKSISPLYHKKNIAAFMSDIKSSYKNFWSARENKRNCQWYNQHRVNKLRRYVKHFNLKMPSLKGILLNNRKTALEIKRYSANVVLRLYDVAHRENQLRDEVSLDIVQLEQDWLEGKTDRTYIQRHEGKIYIYRDFIQLRLRLAKSKRAIETSYGAFVPIKLAKKLFDMNKQGQSVAGHKIGHYTIDSFDGEVLKVGCHKVAITEINRLAKIMKWGNV